MLRYVAKISLREVHRSLLMPDPDWSSSRSISPNTQSCWSGWCTKNTWCLGVEATRNSGRGGSDGWLDTGTDSYITSYHHHHCHMSYTDSVWRHGILITERWSICVTDLPKTRPTVISGPSIRQLCTDLYSRKPRKKSGAGVMRKQLHAGEE